MSEEDLHIYVKVRRDTDIDAPKSIYLKTSIEEFKIRHESTKLDEKSDEVSEFSPGSFSGAITPIYQNAIALKRLSRAFVSITSIVRRLEVNDRLYEVLNTHGRRVKNRKAYQIYEVDASNIGRLEEILDEWGAAGEFTRFLAPAIFSSIVSMYDHFVVSILESIFRANPNVIRGSEKVIPYRDVISFDTLEEAKDYVIEKEVDSIIRESHDEQLRIIAKKIWG